MGAICCHGNQNADLSAPKSHVTSPLPPPPPPKWFFRLQIKFDCDRPTGLRDIHVLKCGHIHTDVSSTPILYTHLWAFGWEAFLILTFLLSERVSAVNQFFLLLQRNGEEPWTGVSMSQPCSWTCPRPYCLPPKLINDKLIAYGLSQDAVDLIDNYLSNRKQCVKIGEKCSSFLNIIKGVPQGSILDPLIFNIFINDIFYFIDKAKLFIYADDNTLSFSHSDFATLVEILIRESKVLIDCFFRNQMKANPDKFQALAVGEKTFALKPKFKIGEAEVECEETVKLLGVEIDSRLKFDVHISAMCRKASQQINVLKRIGKFLNFESRKAVYHAFIMSIFNFCPLIWHFCSKPNTEKLEKINYRALKFVFQDFTSSYEGLLFKAGPQRFIFQDFGLLLLKLLRLHMAYPPHTWKNLYVLKTHPLTISGTQIY